MTKKNDILSHTFKGSGIMENKTNHRGEEERTHGGVYSIVSLGRGRQSGYVDCPFCGKQVSVFVWSISGGGKKCGCGALIYINKALKKLAIIVLFLLTINLSSQVKFTHFNGLDSFSKHRVVTTGISWTGTIVGYKATGKIWKGALIGLGCALSAGIGKEAYDMTGRGVPSWSDMGGNLMGSLVGTVAGSMCCGLAQHIREKKEVERAYKFYNPIL